MTNFRSPYLSKSISQFWSRWHISLSSWFSDYLYIPLGGNRVPVPRWYFNLLFVFLISGLWHGANWTFIIWGVMNGLYLVIAIIFRNIKWMNINTSPGSGFITAKKIVQIATTFLLITFSWIFFRANNVHDAFFIVKKIVSFKGSVFMPEIYNLAYSFMGIFILLWVEITDHRRQATMALFSHKNIVVRYASYLFITVLIFMFGVFDGGQFIYFQF